MSHWLGIDLGNARVGLAMSDPELTFAYPIGNIQVRGDYFQALYEVVDLIDEEQISHVVIGYPLLLDGTEGKSAKKARRWSKALEKHLLNAGMTATVELLDERLTTVSAHRQLIEAGLTTIKHRPNVDQQSAVLLLQAALDNAMRKSESEIAGLED